ncbi:MAG TPA: tetraacyldisaccharide 4'-kinase [Bacteroidales bacterium]
MKVIHIIRCILLPFSILYGWVMRIRNFLFDKHLLRSQSFPLPVISIGNLSVGGTGKTPHTEYLIRLLNARYSVAVLSRGYRRKSKGYILAGSDVTASMIGDEPFQMKRKYPSVTLAVDESRTHGINQLLSDRTQSAPEVLLLDDAYQHRQVTPSLNILLTDVHYPLYDDQMLPTGNLREPICGRKRADIVIVTKCDSEMSESEQEVIRKKLSLLPGQSLFFTTICYRHLCAVFESEAHHKVMALSDLRYDTRVLMVTGIASPKPMLQEIKKYSLHTRSLVFPDHHFFSEKEVHQIAQLFDQIETENKLIIMTEKDAMRFRESPFVSVKMQSYIYYLPIEVGFLANGESKFNQIILNHVESYSGSR